MKAKKSLTNPNIKLIKITVIERNTALRALALSHKSSSLYNIKATNNTNGIAYTHELLTKVVTIANKYTRPASMHDEIPNLVLFTMCYLLYSICTKKDSAMKIIKYITKLVNIIDNCPSMCNLM